MLTFYRLTKGAKLLLAISVLASAVLFAEQQYKKRVCRRIQVSIFHHPTQRLIEECEVHTHIEEGLQGTAVGLPLAELCTKAIASTVEAHSFVREKVVYKTWTGDLRVLVWPETVIARVLMSSGPDQYVTRSGKLLPVSTTRTARTLLIEMDSTQGEELTFFSSDYGKALCSLLRNLYDDLLWRAQITCLRLDKKNRVTLYAQIGKQQIEFGSLKSIQAKLNKLRLYYEKIVPHKGWAAYSRVNLEFDNQIVCE